MTRGRPNELTEIERGLLHAGLVTSLRSGEGRFWAYDAQKRFEEIMDRKLSWGTLLPALRRLEAMGHLTAKWDTPDPDKRPIRFYKLTKTGKLEAGAGTVPAAPVRVGSGQPKKASV